jgi:hypothetical protein
MKTVSTNLALAQSRDAHDAISKVLHEMIADKRALEALIAKAKKHRTPSIDPANEVASAMDVVKNLISLADESQNLASIGELFRTLNVRIFIRFKEVLWGKRKLGKPAGGVITSGNANPPIQIYAGPTSRHRLNDANDNGCSAALAERIEANPSGRERNSLGNVNRSDGTVELFVRFCSEIRGSRSVLLFPRTFEPLPKVGNGTGKTASDKAM